MNKLAVFAFLAVALQATLAKPASDDLTLDKMIKDTKDLVNNLSKQMGFKDVEDANKKITEQLNNNVKDLGNKINEVADKLKTEVSAHKPEIDNAIKQAQAKLSETAASLQKAAGPEATSKAKELKTSLEKGLQDSLAEIQKLVKAVEPDATKVKTQVEATAKGLLEQLTQISKNVDAQLKNSIQEHDKTHKH